MAKVWVDGKAYEMNAGQNLLHGCLSAGLDLPYFCWHPAMGSVGACRQCAVKQYKDESDEKGRIVMACMTPATEGARISIRDEEAAAFRRMVIEGLMTVHPHDCPVCDEGGECHLQDMTVMTGHTYRRYSFQKRTWRNQNLGPLVNHEMNRCIQCYRCVRYYRDFAGGTDLHAFALRDTVFFGRAEDGTLENEFSGNLVEICPTGVFTDKTLRQHYTRKWDLTFAPSICPHCALGCNISPAERYGSLRRIVNRYNSEVNGYFLCDRGRFGYEFANSPQRILKPLLNGTEVPAEAAADALASFVSAGGAIGIGSPRASLEANFALRRMVGAERFFSGMEERQERVVAAMLEILRAGPARTPSLAEIEGADAALVLGEDLTNTAPRMALSLRLMVRQEEFRIAAKLRIPSWLDNSVREASQGARSPLFVATPAATRLDDVAARLFRGAPEEIARLGYGVARALDSSAPDVPELSESTAFLAGFIAEALREAERPVIIAGPSLGSEAVVRAAAAVAHALAAAGKAPLLAFTAPECNTLGLAMMSAPPLTKAFAAGAATVIVLENDLYRRAPAPAVDAFLGAAKHVVALDYLNNGTTRKAELVLPAGSFAESDGTYISSEGRAQRYFQVMPPAGELKESWRWLGIETLDQAIEELIDAMPHFAPIRDAAPEADYRIAQAKIARAPFRYSGRTAETANISVNEPRPPADPDSPLSFTMEGAAVQPPPPLIPFFWSPGWNSHQQAMNRFQEEVAGVLKGGVPGVRMIEPGRGRNGQGKPPAPFAPRAGEWRIVPLYHIFGSEELSAQALALSGMAPAPYVALHPEDAAQLGVRAGDSVSVADARLPVKLLPELPRGVAGLPSGIGPLVSPLPAWSRITP